jgi:uncharacterized repeat protein (TIGR02543 family)
VLRKGEAPDLNAIPVPVREGYTFKGWADAEGNAVELTAFAMPSADVVLTALWEANEAVTDPAETDPAETDPAETDPAETDSAGNDTNEPDTKPSESEPTGTEGTDTGESGGSDTDKPKKGCGSAVTASGLMLPLILLGAWVCGKEKRD